ncbi:STAS domain-containing protein [Sporomusa sphaeroides]|uniref:STAS domain-containing protein n=1 Tax=Sporomusa sphaeroides TaxID=47679 RepID=UPI002B9F3046|nr:STAS domain-containing protein [Sporomusa sphaeroides]HML35085.1 STAS domain-containing protein [Sporomusa sphaeroides]
MEKQKFQIMDSQVIINLTGNLQGELAAQIREAILSYIDKGYSTFQLDFSNVDGINSTGLGMLVNIQKRAFQNGGDVMIHGLTGIVKAAFERTRLTRAFNIFEDQHAIV